MKTKLDEWKMRRCKETIDRYDCLAEMYDIDDILDRCRYCPYQTDYFTFYLACVKISARAEF